MPHSHLRTVVAVVPSRAASSTCVSPARCRSRFSAPPVIAVPGGRPIRFFAMRRAYIMYVPLGKGLPVVPGEKEGLIGAGLLPRAAEEEDRQWVGAAAQPAKGAERVLRVGLDP